MPNWFRNFIYYIFNNNYNHCFQIKFFTLIITKMFIYNEHFFIKKDDLYHLLKTTNLLIK